AERYLPGTDTWQTAGSMTVGRYAHAATLLADGRVLVAGGSGPNYEALADATIWSQATSSFTPAAPMQHARGGWPTATLLPDGRVLVVGGDNTAELYDPAS